jgi:hypothetical protein
MHTRIADPWGERTPFGPGEPWPVRIDQHLALVGQAAKGAKDKELVGVVDACEQDTSRQLLWLTSRMQQAAPQILVVA